MESSCQTAEASSTAMKNRVKPGVAGPGGPDTMAPRR